MTVEETYLLSIGFKRMLPGFWKREKDGVFIERMSPIWHYPNMDQMKEKGDDGWYYWDSIIPRSERIKVKSLKELKL